MNDAADWSAPVQVTEAVRRAGRLAAWGTAVLRGRSAPDDAVDAIVGDDEPHRVVGLADDPVGWSVALGLLRRRGATSLVLVTPVPGDLVGLPGPPDVNRDVLTAGAGVIADGAPSTALVPDLRQFGPADDRGTTVTWRARTADGPVGPGRRPSLSEADRALAESLNAALRRLADLDVARWRPEVATLQEDLDGPTQEVLPPDFPDRGLRLLARAQRMSSVLALGRSDSGAAVTVDEAVRRKETLDDLARAVRHAQAAAWNAGSEPARQRED
jgi:hypothetical protein